MKSSRILLASAVVVAVVSCAPHKGGYDTSNPYGTPAGGQAAVNQPYQPAAPANPTYDTPAAYEDNATVPATPAAIDPVSPPTTPGRVAPAASRAATTHTVVKGDTLGGIANKYQVTMAAIMKANNMTKDTVVLGRKLVIPVR